MATIDIPLQLGRAEVCARNAASKVGLSTKAVSSKWLGKLRWTTDRAYKFRVAEVVLEDQDTGRQFTKQVTLQSNLGYRVV